MRMSQKEFNIVLWKKYRIIHLTVLSQNSDKKCNFNVFLCINTKKCLLHIIFLQPETLLYCALIRLLLLKCMHTTSVEFKFKLIFIIQ